MAYGQNLHLKFSREIVHRRMTYIAIVSNAVWKKLRITIRIMKEKEVGAERNRENKMLKKEANLQAFSYLSNYRTKI